MSVLTVCAQWSVCVCVCVFQVCVSLRSCSSTLHPGLPLLWACLLGIRQDV